MIIEFVNGSLTESVVGRMCWCVCGSIGSCRLNSFRMSEFRQNATANPTPSAMNATTRR